LKSIYTPFPLPNGMFWGQSPRIWAGKSQQFKWTVLVTGRSQNGRIVKFIINSRRSVSCFRMANPRMANLLSENLHANQA